MKGSYDLAVIGGGSAGITAARFAARLGARTALVEKDRIGGDCTWTGCVPSKTLLRSAKVVQEMRTAYRHGIASAEPRVDLEPVMDHVKAVVDGVYSQESPERLEAEGIDVFIGDAHFVDPHTIALGERTLTARRVLIATGARPLIPAVPGLQDAGYLTYESLWSLKDLPSHLLVVGAGPIGCELAQAFRRLGSRVTLVEAADRILLQDEPEAATTMSGVLSEEGVELRLSSPAERAWQDDRGIHLAVGGRELTGDALLVAVGRRPRVEGLDLERAGVTYGDKGISVNDRLRTSRRHIYAAGDCIGGYQFTHYAGWQGFMAVRNALLPGASRAVLDRVPWTTFTDPEVAHVGMVEAQAVARFGSAATASTWPMDRVDRALTDGATMGFLKVVHKKNGTILGATIVAARAGEMIQEWTLAIDHGLKVGDVARSIHVYPTYSMAGMQAAADIEVGRMLNGVSGRVIRGVAQLAR